MKKPILILILTALTVLSPPPCFAQLRIDQLPAATSGSSSDLAVIYQGGVTKKITLRSLTIGGISGGTGTMDLSGYTLTFPSGQAFISPAFSGATTVSGTFDASGATVILPQLNIIPRHDTAAAWAGVAPNNGEIVFYTDTGELYIGDGSTAGGNRLRVTLTTGTQSTASGTVAWQAGTKHRFINTGTSGTAANWWQTGPTTYGGATYDAALSGTLPGTASANFIIYNSGSAFFRGLNLQGGFTSAGTGTFTGNVSAASFNNLFISGSGAFMLIDPGVLASLKSSGTYAPRLTGTASLDWGSIAATTGSTLTVAVAGAVTTNTPAVALGWDGALEAGLLVKQVWVSTSGSVSITLYNSTGSTIDPAARTVRANVWEN